MKHAPHQSMRRSRIRSFCMLRRKMVRWRCPQEGTPCDMYTCVFSMIRNYGNCIHWYLCRIAAAPSFPGLRRFPERRGFKQWIGDDSKALMKVSLEPNNILLPLRVPAQPSDRFIFQLSQAMSLLK